MHEGSVYLLKRLTATGARGVPETWILALICIGLTAGIGTTDATRDQAQAHGTARAQQSPSDNGSPPHLTATAWLVPAQDGNPIRATVSAPPIFAGDTYSLPAPLEALPSRSKHASPTGVAIPVTGGQGDALSPASQASSAQATGFGPIGGQAMLATQGAHNDSPPYIQSPHGDAMAVLMATVPAAWYSGPRQTANSLSSVVNMLHDRIVHASALGLERVLDGQVLTSGAPIAVIVRPDEAMGDLVAVAQRPPAAAGLKLSGVHPNATQYQQPPPTVRVVAQATATPQIVAVATVTPQEVAQATATAQEVTQATAIPQATATPQAVAQATSTAQPTATANVFDQAAVVVTATPDPSPAMPAAVPAPTSTTSEAIFEMPGNAQYFTITGYTATGSRTATGTIPRWGTVAVDPHVIPLGSTVYIQGLGIFRAEDTGGAVIGHHVDVFESTVADAYAITGVRLVGWIPPR